MFAKWMSVVFLFTGLCSCNYFNNNKKKPNMNLKENSKIIEIIKRLEVGMIDFITPGETSYTKKDVETCMDIVNSFLVNMEQSTSKEEGMKFVEKTVLKLNDLNLKCDHQLIETEQREDLAEIIILAGSLKGYNTENEDITEEWREW